MTFTFIFTKVAAHFGPTWEALPVPRGATMVVKLGDSLLDRSSWCPFTMGVPIPIKFVILFNLLALEHKNQKGPVPMVVVPVALPNKRSDIQDALINYLL